jgi:hypothetical protein
MTAYQDWLDNRHDGDDPMVECSRCGESGPASCACLVAQAWLCEACCEADWLGQPDIEADALALLQQIRSDL